jgi:hypothetical protein
MQVFVAPQNPHPDVAVHSPHASCTEQASPGIAGVTPGGVWQVRAPAMVVLGKQRMPFEHSASEAHV